MFKIKQLYLSEGHNFVGHYGKPAGENPIRSCDQIECVAGEGIKGDRFFGHKENFKGQITFFAHEVYEALMQYFQLNSLSPAVFRRNVITAGYDLNQLIGENFEVQGVRFYGTEECKPCFWMNQAVTEGAEEYLKGQGGLRARILSDGILKTDS